MRTLIIAATLASCGLFAGEAASQARPDFSGEWTIAPAQAGQPDGGRQGGPPPEFGSGWGHTVTITQDERTLTVVWPFYTRGDLQPPLRFVYTLDGSPSTNTVMMGRGIQEEVSRVAWQENRLVITTTYAFPHPENGQRTTTQMTRTLSLDASGSLVVETSLPGVAGAPPSRARTVYTRR